MVANTLPLATQIGQVLDTTANLADHIASPQNLFVPLPSLTPNIVQETDKVPHSALAAHNDSLSSNHILEIPLHENAG